MTRKDYVVFARMMKETYPQQPEYSHEHIQGAREQWCKTLEGMVDVFRVDNPRFDARKFEEACGYWDNDN